MALITCKDCKKEFSTDAKRCPHCGAKKKKRYVLFWIVTLFLLYTLGNAITNDRHPQGSTSNSNLAPSWRVTSHRSEMDDSKTVILTKDSVGPITTWLKQEPATLFIRCLEGKTDIFMKTGSAAQPELGRYDKYTVEVRIDDKKPYKELWSQSTDNNSLFASSPIPLAKALSKAKRVLIRFTPFNASSTTAEFDLGGLDAVLPQVGSACKWNP